MVKFQGNPQGPRLLPNELIGFGIADILDIDHPTVGTCLVGADLMPNNGLLVLGEEENRAGAALMPGVQFYSQLLQPGDSLTYNDLSFTGLLNSAQFAGIVVLDLLLAHFDRRIGNPNILVHRGDVGQSMQLIDLGHLAGSAVWELGNLLNHALPSLDEPLPYDPSFRLLLDTIRNPIRSFGPWLEKLEGVSNHEVSTVVQSVPESWQLNILEREALVDFLVDRARATPDYLLRRAKKDSWWA